MTTFVALLRGINVGGNNTLLMADLRAICRGLGWKDVRTYIASGNVVFNAHGGPEALAAQLHKALPLDVPVLVLFGSELRARLSHCPFPTDLGKAVYAFFCLDQPEIDEDAVAQFATTEKIRSKGHTVWLYAPDGIGQSKLVENLHRVITGTAFTGRNLNTITKLVQMLDG
jgi:uncharacterized protein (DUF1697 family)